MKTFVTALKIHGNHKVDDDAFHQGGFRRVRSYAAKLPRMIFIRGMITDEHGVVCSGHHAAIQFRGMWYKSFLRRPKNAN